MALFLLFRVAEHDRNSSGIHSCLVEADSESGARRIATDGAIHGEAKPALGWSILNLSSSELGVKPLPNPLWFDGDAVSLIGHRGR